MNKEIKQRWVNALRSGRYKQGRGALRRITGSGEEYCCLGVLCQLAVDDDVAKCEAEENLFMYECGNRTASSLPNGVAKWARLPDFQFSPKVSIPYEGHIRKFPLFVLNDVLNYSFEEIADLIEEQL
jgi:hypothetical protein